MLMQTHLEFRIVLTGSILVVLTLGTVTTIVMVQSVSAATATPALFSYFIAIPFSVFINNDSDCNWG
jgi:hypothetical protein